MKKSLALIFGVVVALMLAPAANADVSQVFQNTSTPLTCTDSGLRSYCGSPSNAVATTVQSFDGTPLDVAVGFPTNIADVDAALPIVGLYHGWGGNKINISTDPLAQALLANGFAVFTMTDRGWSNSCGGPAAPETTKAWPCTQGYIHLMDNAYEVRDAQYLLGQLADDRTVADDADLIQPTEIGAAGGSYGGAISAQLAMLKNRIQLPNGQLVAWQSPKGKAMEIAATAPQYAWSDLAASLAPNGSTLDYAKYNPYNGPNGAARTGVNKQQWVFNLYAVGAQAGYYAPEGVPNPVTGYPDPHANIKGWYRLLSNGNPFDSTVTSGYASMLNEIKTDHSAYYIPINNSGQQPAPMLISSGWNDDLFPVTEGVRLYNKVRANDPTTPVVFWGVDIGHTPRSNTDNASRTADATPLIGTQVAWMTRYLKNLPAPLMGGQIAPVGGVAATSSKCGTGAGAQTRVAGDTTYGANWADMTNGQITIAGADEQTIEPGTSPSDQFVSTSTDVCDYAGRTDDTEGAAIYSEQIGTGGINIIGSPTVEADFNVTGTNDQIIARLYDVDPAGIGHQRLISRGVYRPNNIGGGFGKQVFQLNPQNYAVPAGNTLKLELLSSDSPFSMNSKGIHQQPIQVKNLRLSVPTAESNGAAGGQVTNVTPKELPSGYAFSDDALATDTLEPITTDNVPGTLQQSVTVTLTGVDRGISGVETIYYEKGVSPATPTTSSPVYDPNNKPTLADGESISYFAVDRAGNEETPSTSAAAQVDSTPPVAPTVTGPSGTINDTTATIGFTIAEVGGSSACSLDGAPSVACSSPWQLSGITPGTHTARVYSIDSVGNVSAPGAVTWTVQGLLTTTVKISGTVKIGKTITATPTSKWGSTTVSGVKYTYSWTANGKKVGSKNKLKLSKKWKGKKIVVKVSASKTGYKSSTTKKTATSKLK